MYLHSAQCVLQAESEGAKNDEGLSWAAALILAIPPSLLAIILAHHIAKRHAGSGSGEVPSDLRGDEGRFGSSTGGFDVESDSDYSVDDEFLRAEGEATSFVDYTGRPAIFRRNSRLRRRALPRFWVHGSPQPRFYRSLRQPIPRDNEEVFNHAYIDGPWGLDAGDLESARPLSHGYAEPEYLGDPAWALAARGDPDMKIHGGL